MRSIAKEELDSWVDISSAAIRANITMLRGIAETNNKSFMLMIKANAYGHGAVGIATIANQEGAAFLGIAHLDEAILLRASGIKQSLMLFTEPPLSRVSSVKETGVILVVSTQQMLTRILAMAPDKRPVFHLKFNTGLNRFGFQPNEVSEIITLLKSSHTKSDGILTHYSSATADPIRTAAEHKSFVNVINQFKSADILPAYVHASNSAATAWLIERDTNLVRLGLAAYGLQPNTSRPMKLLPSLSWHTRVVAINKLAKGEMIGYNGTWIAKTKSAIAIIPVGYSDGLRRGPRHQQRVLISGQLLPIVGTIMMNHTFIDCTQLTKPVAIGDLVTIIGAQNDVSISIEEVAEQLNTTNEEVATTIAPYTPRFYC